MNTTDSPFQYFTAEFLGWNGSRSRVIASATGCWDDEAEAEAALDKAIDTAFRTYCDGRGLDPEGEDSQDEFSGNRSDYQRTSVRYLCIPSVDGRLDHAQSQWVSPGELPMLAEKATINLDAPMCEQTIHRGDMSIPAIDDLVAQAGHSSAVQFVNDSALWNVPLSEVVAMLKKDIADDFDPDAGSAAPLIGREQDAAGDRYFAR